MRTDLTPIQKIQFLIVQDCMAWEAEGAPFALDYATVTADQLAEAVEHYKENDSWYDARNERHHYGHRSGLPAETSRYLETEALAAQLPDETWVGWTHYYGGGKHAEPDAVDWISTAHDVVCIPTQMIVNVFQRPIPGVNVPHTVESAKEKMQAMKSDVVVSLKDGEEAAIFKLAAEEMAAESSAWQSVFHIHSQRAHDFTTGQSVDRFTVYRTPF